MPSASLTQLKNGLNEVQALQRANPSPIVGGGFQKPAITRAIGRAEVVLLSGHLERYVYSIYEEIIDSLTSRSTLTRHLPAEIRLLQSRPPIDELAITQWDRREKLLRQHLGSIHDLWDDQKGVNTLTAETLLAWMKSPSPKSLVRAFRAWGIQDVFIAITRSATHRARIRLKIQELVDKRNNIAHGDLTVEATHLDVRSYQRAVREFCERTDRRCSARVAIITEQARPW